MIVESRISRYVWEENDVVWGEEALDKVAGPTASSVHVNRPLGSEEEEEKKKVTKANPCHVPSGPQGGQFCSTGGAGTSGLGLSNPYKGTFAKGKEAIFDLLSDGKWHMETEVLGAAAKAGSKFPNTLLQSVKMQGAIELAVDKPGYGKLGWRIEKIDTGIGVTLYKMTKVVPTKTTPTMSPATTRVTAPKPVPPIPVPKPNPSASMDKLAKFYEAGTPKHKIANLLADGNFHPVQDCLNIATNGGWKYPKLALYYVKQDGKKSGLWTVQTTGKKAGALVRAIPSGSIPSGTLPQTKTVTASLKRTIGPRSSAAPIASAPAAKPWVGKISNDPGDYRMMDKTQLNHSWVPKAWASIYNKPEYANISSTVTSYTGAGNIGVNGMLRSGKYDPNKPSYITERVKALDTAMKHFKTDKNIVVWRGCHNCFQGKVGSVVQDKGFLSTSVSINSAFHNSYKTKYKILVPKGASVLPVGAKSSHPNEGEVILPRDSRLFKVDETTLRLILDDE